MDGPSTAPSTQPQGGGQGGRQGRQDKAPRRLAALPAAALLVPLLILGANAWVGWNAAWRNATTELVRTADAGAEYATRVLAGYVFALGRIGDLVQGLSDVEITAREPELHAALRRMIAELPQAEAGFVVDRRGYPLLAANIYPVPREVPTAADRDFFLALSEPAPPTLHVSQIYRSRFDNRRFFALSRRRTGTGNGLPDGHFDGLINVSVFPEVISAGMLYLLREPDDALGLLRLDSAPLARTSMAEANPPAFSRPFPPGLDRWIEQDDVSRVDGERQVAVRRRIEGFPLFVGARRPHRVIVADWWHDQLPTLLFGLPTTLALFLLSLRVQRAKTRLAEANGRLGDALVESEDWLRRTTDGAGIGTWERYSGSGQLLGSAQLHRLLGLHPATEPVTVERLRAMVPAASQAGLTAMMQAARQTGRAGMELPILRPRAGLPPEPAWLALEAQCAAPGDPAGRVFGIAYDITARRAAEDRVALLLRRSVEQQEAERLRIARDLHDRLGQYLTLLHLELGGLATDPAPAARAARLQAIAREIGEEANRLAVELRPTAIDDLGLGTALRQLVEDWGARTGLATELHLRLPARRLPLPVETTLYRILQEALTNVVRHAGATRVGVTLEATAAELRMVVEDDGRGMPAQRDPAAPPALGLRGIEERLALLGGGLEIESAPGRGTTLLIGVPL